MPLVQEEQILGQLLLHIDGQHRDAAGALAQGHVAQVELAEPLTAERYALGGLAHRNAVLDGRGRFGGLHGPEILAREGLRGGCGEAVERGGRVKA